jgi:Protein of unknown function (DUF1203)
MGAYRVIAVSEEIAREVRETGRSPRYGHPTHSEVAKGYGPCRLCLRFFVKGEDRRILFTYDAFEGTESLPLPGPVFIHESPCVRYPEDAGFPSHLGQHRLTLNAYGRGRRLQAEEHVDDGRVEPVLVRLLDRREVDYIHVRDTGAGCYDVRIERA